MGELHVMDEGGDTKIVWDKDVPAEVEAARELFDKMKGKKYLAYSVKKGGKKDQVIGGFDADAEKLIMAPMMKGG